MSTISVVIPVYRTQAYLDRCVASVLAQTHEDLDVILVDDGSPDKSGEICDGYAKADSRVRVFHQRNQGLSAARNAGIAAARGEYIGFVDSDDWIRSDMYQRLLSNINSFNAQLAVCDSLRVFDGRAPIKQKRDSAPPFAMSGREALANMLTGAATGGHTAWNKLYSKDLFNGVRYPAGRIFEDAFTTSRLYYQCDTVAYDKEQCYYYYQRPGSIMGRGFSKKAMDALEAAREIESFVKENCPELVKHADCFTVITCLSLIYRIIASGREKNREYYDEVKAALYEKRASVMGGPYLSGKHKAALRLLRASEGLYTLAWDIYLRRS